MGLFQLLFGVRGRISRTQYWLGSFLSSFVMAAGVMVAISAASGAADGMRKTGLEMLAGLGAFGLALVPFAILVAWIGIAVQIKRFHDRGRGWYFVLLPLAPALLMIVAAVEGLASNASVSQLVGTTQPYLMLGWAINLFLFVDLACLPGVEGPNKYGPPPGSPPAPAAAPSPTDPKSALFGAHSAIDKALAERARQAEAPKPVVQPSPSFGAAAPAPAAAAAGFGRRAPR